MKWFIRLPRYGRPLAALNRNGIDIERRPRRRLAKAAIALASLVQEMPALARFLDHSARILHFPLLIHTPRPLRPADFPHVPRGYELLS